MEWRWNSPIIYRFGTLFKFYISLIPHILNYLRLLYPIFRKCLVFFKSNPGFGDMPKIQSTDNQRYANFENFANHLLQFPSNGLLRKTHSFFPDFIGCKDTHFSQMSQAFWVFSSFSKIIQYPDLPHFSQNPQNEALVKNSFFANDLDL